MKPSDSLFTSTGLLIELVLCLFSRFWFSTRLGRCAVWGLRFSSFWLR